MKGKGGSYEKEMEQAGIEERNNENSYTLSKYSGVLLLADKEKRTYDGR